MSPFEEENLPCPEEHSMDPSGLIHCNGTLRLPGFEEGNQQVFHDWYTGDKGWLDIHAAFEQSCNIYFWSVALGTWQAYKLTRSGEHHPGLGRSLRLWQLTGVDLTGEAAGIVPDRALFDAVETVPGRKPRCSRPARAQPARSARGTVPRRRPDELGHRPG